jgi:hypothetical protein
MELRRQFGFLTGLEERKKERKKDRKKERRDGSVCSA